MLKIFLSGKKMKLLNNTWSMLLLLVKTNGVRTMFVDAHKKSGGIQGWRRVGLTFSSSLWNCLGNLISFSCFGNVNSTLKWEWMGRVYLASLPSQGEGISHITKGIGPVLDN